MKCPACHFEQSDGNTSCEGCGLIFKKYDPNFTKSGSPGPDPPSFPMGRVKRPLPSPARRLRFINPFLYVSLIFLAYDVYAAGSLCLFLHKSRHAPGRVLAIIRAQSGSRPSNNYTPQVQFTLPDGKTLVAEQRAAGFSFTLPSPGDEVDVLYDPDHPEDMRINAFATMWFGLILYTLLLLPGLWLGFYPFFVD